HFGPLIRLWTLRFESKHSYFKRCGRKLHNFKNLCSTLVERHPFLQAYLHAGSLFPPLLQTGETTEFDDQLYQTEKKMDSIVSAIHTVLPQLEGKKLEMLVDELVSKLGVEGPNDLQFKEEDIAHLLSPIQCRTILHSFKKEIVASSSTVFDLTQGTILCENSSWLDRFQVPWDKMRPTLKRAIDADKRPEPEDRRHMVRVIVDSMRVHCLNPSRKDCSAVAKEITQKYSGSFLDKTKEGEIIGCGYFSNTLSRLRKPRCSRTSGDDQPSAGKCAKIDSYGCITWQPQEYPKGKSSASLEEKRKEMVDLFTQEGPRATERGTLKELMTITYAKQREDINSDPPLSIIDISKKWSFFLSFKFLLSHFTTLTGIELHSRLNNDLDKKGKRLLEFFHVQIMKWSKEVKTVLKEALKDDREGTDGLAAMLIMMAYFKEAEDSLFLLSLFLSLFVFWKYCCKYFFEKYLGFFNIAVPFFKSSKVGSNCLFLVRINPESSKCSSKVQTSRKSGKNVKRKTSYMKPRVVAFMRDFTDFDWQNN
uniref:Uncharacterized protein n=1 Tax=Cyprinus carpio TaxID=7962 RepID=A0A8C1S326_CYPCA